ncbi:hypothetical protein G9464_03060 [Halostella sp. JP-L12]|uniref:hypothetical protein n=1 Tax=Halostella TaxID=1843185 RepID=UPI000EF7CAB0|nr:MULTISPECIES: hypothetical protein [Halostella]NHN46578.1 hypothetical protein [Halostella sp. JP-L12]
MASEPATTEREHERTRDLAEIAADGTPFVVAAATFFLGSAVLTQSGEPGASTPVPWLVSHALWTVATVVLAVGSIAVVRRFSGLETGVASAVATGAFGLGVLHALQWTTWVYVDVVAHQRGAHSELLEPLLHPFGTGHMLMYGILVGGGVAATGWGLRRLPATHRTIDYAGIAVGAATVAAAATALLTVAPVRSPTSLATIGLLAADYAWVAVLGTALYRGRNGGRRAR